MWAIFHRMFTNEHFAQALWFQLLVLSSKSQTFCALFVLMTVLVRERCSRCVGMIVQSLDSEGLRGSSHVLQPNAAAAAQPDWQLWRASPITTPPTPPPAIFLFFITIPSQLLLSICFTFTCQTVIDAINCNSYYFHSNPLFDVFLPCSVQFVALLFKGLLHELRRNSWHNCYSWWGKLFPLMFHYQTVNFSLLTFCLKASKLSQLVNLHPFWMM